MLLLLALVVSIDGFWGGFAYGLRGVGIPPSSLGGIGLLSFAGSLAALVLGIQASIILPAWLTSKGSAFLFILLGLNALRQVNLPLCGGHHPSPQGENRISAREAFLLGGAVALDASGAAFALGMAGLNLPFAPFLFGLTHVFLVKVGNVFALKKLSPLIRGRFAFFPGCFLVLLGVFRLFKG